MLDVNHLCPGCMGLWEDTGRPCPHCGFSWETAPAGGRELPIFTILAGRYLLGRRIGIGGFGITYLAMDLTEERVTAIKEFFPASLAGREGLEVAALPGEEGRYFREALRSFRKEADLLSRFADVPGIVRYRDYVTENGTAYLVMDYIEGTNLRRYMRETGKTFSQDEALELMKPILLAVEAMHGKGVLHRDISPENLIWKPDGTLTLIDFGAAREFSLDEEENLTVILKHGYAPEEQYHSGSRQGPWTDLYACCAVLYQMVSGIQPQDAAARGQKDELLTLDEIEGVQVTERFARIIEKGMTIHATERYASIQALMAELYGDDTGQPEQKKDGLDGQEPERQNRDEPKHGVINKEEWQEDQPEGQSTEEQEPEKRKEREERREPGAAPGAASPGAHAKRKASGKKAVIAAAAVLVILVVLVVFHVIPLEGSLDSDRNDDTFAESEKTADVPDKVFSLQEDGFVWLCTEIQAPASGDHCLFEYNERGNWSKITGDGVAPQDFSSLNRCSSPEEMGFDTESTDLEYSYETMVVFKYEYDQYGRIISASQDSGGGMTFTYEYTYRNISSDIPEQIRNTEFLLTINLNGFGQITDITMGEEATISNEEMESVTIESVSDLYRYLSPDSEGERDEYGNVLESNGLSYSYAEYEIKDGIYTPTRRTSGTLPGAAAEGEEGNASQTADMAEVEEADLAAASDTGAVSSALDEEAQRALTDLLGNYGLVGDSLTYPVNYTGEEALWEALETGIIDYVLGGCVASLDELSEGYCAVLPPESWFPDTHTADTIITRDMDTCMRITLLLLEERYYEGDRAYGFLSDFEGDWEPGDSMAVQTDNALRYELALQYLEYWGEETGNSWMITDTESGQSAGDNNLFFE